MNYICNGCQAEIVEGQHFMEVSVKIETRIPEGYQPVINLPPTILNGTVHNPHCLARWLIEDALILDVFAH